MTEPGAGRPEEDHKILLFLAYFGILALVPYLVCGNQRSDPGKNYVYGHARQGLALAVAVMVLCGLLFFGDVLLAFIPGYGTALQHAGWILLIAIAALLTAIGWIQAFRGREWRLPLIGGLAEKWL
jgi:uncharacterized membrane protein